MCIYIYIICNSYIHILKPVKCIQMFNPGVLQFEMFETRNDGSGKLRCQLLTHVISRVQQHQDISGLSFSVSIALEPRKLHLRTNRPNGKKYNASTDFGSADGG